MMKVAHADSRVYSVSGAGPTVTWVTFSSRLRLAIAIESPLTDYSWSNRGTSTRPLTNSIVRRNESLAVLRAATVPYRRRQISFDNLIESCLTLLNDCSVDE